MRLPQVLNFSTLTPDQVIAVDGANVIDDTTQEQLGQTLTLIPVNIDIYGLASASHVGTYAAYLEYEATVDWWIIRTLYFSQYLSDQEKYVATITDPGLANNMRLIKVHEFSVDNGGLEATLMRLPFQVEIGDGEAWIRWYNTEGDFAFPQAALYKAPLYQNGVGTTPATDPARVTHRGAVIVNPQSE